jgi:hypothetical protein
MLLTIQFKYCSIELDYFSSTFSFDIMEKKCKGVGYKSGDQIQILVAMCVCLACVIGIGLYYMRTASKSSDNYFIGGR